MNLKEIKANNEISSSNESLLKIVSFKIIDESIKDLLMNFKFLDLALSSFNFSLIEDDSLKTIGTDGNTIFFNPNYLIDSFQELNEKTNNRRFNLTRMIMHSLLHCVFFHHKSLVSNILPSVWDLACDITTEYIIDDLNNPIFSNKLTSLDGDKNNIYLKFKKSLKQKYNNSNFIVKNVYEHLLECTNEQLSLYQSLFVVDEHYNWKYNNEDQEEIKNEEYNKKIIQYMQTGIELQEKIKGVHYQELHKQLKLQTTTKYDYKKFLRRFMELKESVTVDVDSFDPIYYTLGLKLYKNIPLIEYNEVKEEYTIEDLVLILDTSASTYGKLVEKFVNETWSIISQVFNSNKDFAIRLHIIQADLEVKDYKIITSSEDFKEYINNFEVIGGSGTDFRPALEYVNDMKQKMLFKNLKGVIYFTDGYGEYPKKALDFETVFVFCIDDEYITEDINVPSWAMKLILTKNDIMEE